MDVNNVNNSFHAGLSSPNSNKVNKDAGFREIFEREVSQVSATAAQSEARTKGSVLDHGDKILGLLDDYAKELSDPSKRLADIEPLVKRIQEATGHIETEAGFKAHADKELERLIRDLAVTANVAVFKFHRGDFI